jgi:cobalt/nickel transport system ATP-binding protein
MHKDSPVINLRNLRFGYESGHPVLDGLDFTLQAGESVGLVGDNGSGKTTLLHLLVGLLKPQSGEVEIMGKVRREEKDFVEVRENVGLLFQDAEDQLFCPTVEEDIAFGPLNLGKSREQVRGIVDAALEKIDMADFKHRVTHHLSGGEKKLISLATILAMEPEVLLLDEPVANLDETTSMRLGPILNELPQAKIIISHDAGFLSQVVSKIWRLKDCKITA